MTLAKNRAFDPACFTLAESALPAAAGYGLKSDLAVAIQECIEDWLANHSITLERKFGPNWESEL